jgi:hypothetical protein
MIWTIALPSMDFFDNEAAHLRAENARLIALLDQSGIAWQTQQTESVIAPKTAPDSSTAERGSAQLIAFSTADKIALFRRLFYGRSDVYPVRWESKATHKSGYAPACGNEWRVGVCEKPKIKCTDCQHRQLLPVSDEAIYNHLAGRHTIGLYLLLEDDSCHLLAVDFDEAQWQDDIKAFAQTCQLLDVPVALEISRSGNGAHAWIFFETKVLAQDARRLGAALISHTCAQSHQLKLTSYDRLFPNQDTLPKGGFGNLIALPLQKLPRASGHSIFVDQTLTPHPDQWAFLAKIRRMSPLEIEPIIMQAIGSSHPLDVNFIDDEDLKEPWQSQGNG